MCHRIRNKPFLLISVLLISVLLTACGTSSEAPPAEQPAAAPTEAVATEAPAAEPTAAPAEEIAASAAQAVAEAASRSFQAWAAANAEPYRDESVAVLENDGFFATVQVTAWFRPSREAAWEERQAQAECRLVGDVWQCDEAFAFALSQGEQARRAQATATAEASRPPMWTEPATDMAFVRVPAGEFTMGSDSALDPSAWDDEMPQHQVYLDEYSIGQTEVTNAQYRLFIEAGGYDEPEYWTDAGWQWRQEAEATQPRCWDDGDLNQPDQPVVCVTWYEAAAHTRWLSAATGLAARLPSEAEWEKAARGIDGRIYPWGNEWDGTRVNSCDVNCNSDEAFDDGYDYRAPVGSYPEGASPYGALDMAGNVWEWTSTAWGGCERPDPYTYPYAADDGREVQEGGECRTLRGGSFRLSDVFVRCAFRGGDGPIGGLDYFGFRVVVSSPGF